MYISQTQLHASWRQAFDSVIDQYTAVKSTHGSNQCFDYQKLDQSKGQNSPKVVKPSLSDFLADVEIAAKESLSPVELAIFRQCFMEFTHDPERVKEEYMTPIKETLGRILVAKKIHPVRLYLKGKDVR